MSLLLAFRRQFRRVPEPVKLLGFYALLFLPLYAPVLTGHWIYAAGDTLGFNYPPLRALRPFSIDSLLADPYSGRGFPWLVTYGTLDPVAHVLRLFCNEFQTLAWLCYLYMAAGAWLFALFLRRNHSPIAAFVGGLVYACAFFWTGDGDYPLMSSLPILAAMLLILSQAKNSPCRSGVHLVVAIWYGWMGGHFNFLPIILVGGGVVSLYAAWQAPRAGRFRVSLGFTGGVIGGTAIGLVKLVPALAYVQLSERAGGLSVAAASASTIQPSFLLTALFPYLRPPLLPGDTGSLFFGSLALGLLLVGVLAPQRFRVPLAAFGCIVLIALPHSPFYWLLQHLPFFSFLRTPTRWLLLGNAAAATTVAGVVDAVEHGELTRQRRMVGRAFLWITAAFFVLSLAVTVVAALWSVQIIGAMTWIFDTYLFSRTSGLPLAHYHRYLALTWEQMAATVSLLSPRFTLPFLGLLAAGLWLRERPWPVRRLPWSLPILIVLTSLPPLFFYHSRVPAALVERGRATMQEALVEDAFVMPVMPAFSDYLLRATQSDDDDASERLVYQLALLVPNMEALLDVRSIDFYQPIQPRRMARLLAALGSDTAPAPTAERLATAPLSVEKKIRTFVARRPLLSLLGVTHVVSAWELPPPFRLVADLRPVDHLPSVHVYELEARPLAYSPSRAVQSSVDEEATIRRLRDAAYSDDSFLECGSCAGESQPSHVEVAVRSETSTELRLTAKAPVDSWLIVNKPRLPGWRVTIDGEEVKTAYANALFFGIPVPAGTHEVTLRITYGTLWADSWARLTTGEDPWLL